MLLNEEIIGATGNKSGEHKETALCNTLFTVTATGRAKYLLGDSGTKEATQHKDAGNFQQIPGIHLRQRCLLRQKALV